MPARTRWWCTEEVASRLGIGACASFTPLSLKTRTAEPPLTALSALSQSLPRAYSIPPSPAETEKSVLKVVEAEGPVLMCRILSSSAAVSMG